VAHLLFPIEQGFCDVDADVKRSLERAVQALLEKRNAEGFWEGRLASSPLAAGVCICALADEPGLHVQVSKAFSYLAKTQNADGGWGDTEISKSNLAATLLVASADALCHGLSDEQRRGAKAYIDALGGAQEGLRRIYGKDMTFQVPLRMAGAAAGLLPWNKVDALPFELALVPRGLMGAFRLPVVSYALPALVCVGLARHAKAPTWFLPWRWLRASVAEKALTFTHCLQPASGGFLEATPITAFCLLGLKAAGRGEHPIAQSARRFILESQRPDGSWPVEVNLSIWNTTRAIDALAASGWMTVALNEKERNRTRDWLLAQQTTTGHVYSDAKPGGWGWNHFSGSVPDADDTSGAILALRHLGVAENHPSLVAGKRWLLALQNPNGGWPTFCRGWEKLPFDRSAPDLTAHALRALSSPNVNDSDSGLDANELPALATSRTRGMAYLTKIQKKDGSFAPLWFGCEQAKDELNYTYGSTHVIFATGREHPTGAAALEWLKRIQNADGSFGGTAGSRGSAEETGLALRALLAGGEKPDAAGCVSAAKWLVEHQRADGSWDPAPIGFYFAVLWYYEELYPLCYALGGLGRVQTHV